MDQKEVDRLARMIWDYHHMGHTITSGDCILALGSHDPRVAVRAAELWLEERAPLLVLSGGLGRLTEGVWDRPEAEVFAEIARGMGVPDANILVENRSTNTGENILFTRELLRRERRDPGRFIVVQKPYMERRAYATFRKRWSEKRVVVTSPTISYDDYPNEKISRNDLISIMVGDLQRIRVYAELGYQEPQPIPPSIWSAFEQLSALGYTSHLIRG